MLRHSKLAKQWMIIDVHQTPCAQTKQVSLDWHHILHVEARPQSIRLAAGPIHAYDEHGVALYLTAWQLRTSELHPNKSPIFPGTQTSISQLSMLAWMQAHTSVLSFTVLATRQYPWSDSAITKHCTLQRRQHHYIHWVISCAACQQQSNPTSISLVSIARWCVSLCSEL